MAEKITKAQNWRRAAIFSTMRAVPRRGIPTKANLLALQKARN